MYIPKKFEENDLEKQLAFMRQFSFALFITGNGRPWATHLPFTIEQVGQEVQLFTHMATANNQWKLLDAQQEVLVVFSGPHAYISPTNYERTENVPTWNYIAIHAYGKASILGEEQKIPVLEKMINNYEKAYMPQFRGLKPEYLHNMLPEIVALEIKVTEIQGKFKLSQNKKETEKQNIIGSLQASEDHAVADLAKRMQQYYSRD